MGWVYALSMHTAAALERYDRFVDHILKVFGCEDFDRLQDALVEQHRIQISIQGKDMTITFDKLLKNPSLFYNGGCSVSLDDLKHLASHGIVVDAIDKQQAHSARECCIGIRVENFLSTCILELSNQLPRQLLGPEDKLFAKGRFLIYGSPLEIREFKYSPLGRAGYGLEIATSIDCRITNHGVLATAIPQQQELHNLKEAQYVLVNALATGKPVQRFNIDTTKFISCRKTNP